METEPLELLFRQALLLDMPSLNAFCETSSNLNNLLCQNENFWKTKFQHDFGWLPLEYTGSWRELYLNYQNLWLLHNGELNFTGKKAQQVTIGHEVAFIDLQNRLFHIQSNGVPEPILTEHETIFQAIQVSASSTHSLFIDQYNQLWGYGEFIAGQLGIDPAEYVDYDPNEGYTLDNIRFDKPVIIEGVEAIQTAAGPNRTYWRDPENNLYFLGEGENIPVDLNFRAIQVVDGDFYTVILDLENMVHYIKHEEELETEIISMNFEGKKIAAGGNRLAVIDPDNQLWIFDENEVLTPLNEEALDILIGNNLLGRIDLQYKVLINSKVIENFRGSQLVTGNNTIGLIGTLLE
jgi:hypothetical protein